LNSGSCDPPPKPFKAISNFDARAHFFDPYAEVRTSRQFGVLKDSYGFRFDQAIEK
jgi:hypothetical protein